MFLCSGRAGAGKVISKKPIAEKDEFEHPEQRHGWDPACIQNNSVAGVGIRNSFMHACVWWLFPS